MLKSLPFTLGVLFLAIAAAAANHGALLQWTASPSASCLTATPPTCTAFSYQVFEGPAPGQESTTPLATVSGTSYDDSGPTMNAYLGTMRCWTVQAVQTTGGLVLNSSSSGETCATFPAAPQTPGVPTITLH